MRSLKRIVALLPWCSSVCLSVCLSGTNVHCDHMVHVTADLSLWLDSPIVWAPWHQSTSAYSQPSFFHFRLEERWDMDKCKLNVISQEQLKIEVKLLIGSHTCRADWQHNGWPWVTLNDLHMHRAISAVAELLVFSLSWSVSCDVKLIVYHSNQLCRTLQANMQGGPKKTGLFFESL